MSGILGVCHINHTAVVLSGVTIKSSTTKISEERHVLK